MPATQTITLSWPEPDIALLTLDAPDKGANILSRSVLAELSSHLDELEGKRDLAGLIVMSGKPGTFIAGADLREFVASLGEPCERIAELCSEGQSLFARLSKTDFVTVAAIDGICVGGGAEVASWCDRRVLSDGPKTELGFPEVKLGLFPGWGGTARAPRMVGLGNAVEMITTGDSIDANAACKMGWACDVVPVDELLAAAIRVVRDEQRTGTYLEDRERWSQPVDISGTELGFLGVTASAVIRKNTKGKYPAPEAALETLLEGSLQDIEAACKIEAEAMSQLFGSPVNAALLNVFFLTDRNKKDKGLDRDGVEARSVERVGVIGAGIMGYSIAAANLRRNMPVVITDAARDALANGAKKALQEAAFDRQLKGASPERLGEVAAIMSITTTDEEFAGCDVVVEAVVENMEVKKKIFERLESRLPEGTILASNTSTIPITKLARQLKRPESFCGIHFFNPVRRMKLVEVIRGELTSDETVVTAVNYAKRIGKMPIVVNDGPGFLVNRLLLPYMNEALEMVCEGAEINSIEKAAKSFGMPMGPIELYDMVGIDTAMYAGLTMWEAFPDRIVANPVLPAMFKAGRLGQKSGRGFFSYENKKKRPEPDPTIHELLDTYIRKRRSFSQEEISDRLFLPILLEATRILEENIVRDPRDIDLGLILGLGFPPFKGGLMYWADTLGAAKIIERLKPLDYVGPRVKPTELLLEMAADGRKFYP